MIWQERPKAIIMVTNLFENGKVQQLQMLFILFKLIYFEQHKFTQYKG